MSRTAAHHRENPAEKVATSVVAAAALVRSAGALFEGTPSQGGHGAHRVQDRREGAGAIAGLHRSTTATHPTEPAEAHAGRAGDRDEERQDPRERARLARQGGHGRGADRASDIPLRGWRDIAVRVVKEAKDDNLPLLAAGVAFFSLLSLFPALVAIVSIYGIAADPGEVATQLESFTRAMPAQAGDLIISQVETIAGSSSGALGIGVAVGIVTALWSASSGMKWLMTALSLIYDEPEDRKFIKLRGGAIVLTVCAAAGLVVSLGLIAAMPSVSRWLGLGSTGKVAASILRWPLLLVLVLAGLAVLYRYGPNRDKAKWRWATWGSGIAAALWLLGSIGFAVYASVAGSFNESYGSIAGVVVLMLWLLVSVFAVLIGGEINAEMEHQTARDTTAGRPEPLGLRGATMADEVGEPAS